MKWISVKDRLPEFDYCTVLVLVDPKFQSSGVHIACTEENEWCVLSATGNHKDFITHWMELPELPKQQ